VAPSPAPLGVGGSTARAVPCGELAVVVSSPAAAVTRSLANVEAHERVLRAYVSAGATVLPVRFGQQFDSDADCCRDVAERSGRLAALLRQREGCVEMRVLVPLGGEGEGEGEGSASRGAPVEAPERGPGLAYLESLRPRRVTNVALRDALGPLVRGERVEELDRYRGVAIAHLIQRKDEAEYRSALALLPGLTDARVLGPFALYSFSEPDE